MKRGQILHPATRFLWAEGDDLRGDNLGSWGFNPGTAAKGFADSPFWDSPAAFHLVSATWNYADGHAENHKWQDATTIAFCLAQTPNKDGATIASETTADVHSVHDLPWIGQRYPSPQNPWRCGFKAFMPGDEIEFINHNSLCAYATNGCC